MAPRITIEPAAPRHLGEVLALLSRANLPADGVEEYFEGFLLARGDGGNIVGCAGLERHGRLGLVRSVAVLEGFQGQNIGSRLVGALLERAAAEGIVEAALLTTTARDYFEKKFGFRESPRSRYGKRLAKSPEWNLPRCSSAVFMTLRLGPRTPRGQAERLWA